MISNNPPLIEPWGMNHLEEVAQLCAGNIAGLPQRLDCMGLQLPQIATTAIIQKALLSFQNTPETENGPAATGWLALDRVTRRVRAVLGARFFHLQPDEAGYTYLPPAYSLTPWWICQAESLQAAIECLPALFAVWQEAAKTQKISRLQVPVFSGQWATGAIWRRMGFWQDHIMAGQPMAVWQPPKAPVNPSVKVRVAHEADLENLTDLALEEHLHHALHTRTGTSPNQPRETSRRIAEETLARPASQCCQLIAEVLQEGSSSFSAAGSIVGVIMEVEEDHLARFYTPARHGYIGLTSVSAKERGLGVGRAMVEQLRLWFAEQQVETVFLHYVADNVLSNGFWSHMGFAPFQEVLSFRI